MHTCSRLGPLSLATRYLRRWLVRFWLHGFEGEECPCSFAQHPGVRPGDRASRSSSRKSGLNQLQPEQAGMPLRRTDLTRRTATSTKVAEPTCAGEADGRLTGKEVAVFASENQVLSSTDDP